jgi:hypothetical protein
MARIKIEDLPPLTELTPEEMAALMGAGPVRSTRLGIESLESRELMDSGLSASLSGSVLQVQDTRAGDTIHVRQVNGQISIDGITIQTAAGSKMSVSLSALSQIEIGTPGGHDQVWLGDAGQPLTLPVVLPEGVASDTLFTPAFPGGLTLPGDVTKAAEQVNGKVFALHTDGSLTSLSSVANATWQVQSKSVADFGLDGQGDLFSLSPDGTLYRLNSDGSSAVIGGSVASFQVADGNLFALSRTGDLLKAPAATVAYGGFTQIGGSVASFQVAGGNLFTLQRTGDLLKAPASTVALGDFTQIGGSVASFQVAGGNLFTLQRTGDLLKAAAATVGSGSNFTQIAGSVAQFQAENGQLFWLSRVGDLMTAGVGLGATSAITSTKVAGSVAQFQIENGQVFWLNRIGDFMTASVWGAMTGGTAPVEVAGSVTHFQVENGQVFWLNRVGDLMTASVWGAVTSGATPVQIAGSVASFQVYNGHLFWLSRTGDLMGASIWGAVTGGAAPVQIAGSVASFQVENGEMFWLSRTGDFMTASVWGAITGGASPIEVAGSVTSFQVYNDQVFWLNRVGDLMTAPVWGAVTGGATPVKVTGSVAEFQVENGQVFWLNRVGDLMTASVWGAVTGGANPVKVVGGVTQFQVENGQAFWLDASRNLWTAPVWAASGGQADSNYFVKITADIAKFQVENGELFWLTQAGDLWSSPVWAAAVAPTTQSSWVHIIGSVSQFQVENGQVFWLTTTGDLWSAPLWAAVVAPTIPASWVHITGSVSQFQVENGELLWLSRAGDLWSSPIWAAVIAPTTPASWVKVTSGVSQFQVENGELLWRTTQTGDLWSAPMWAAVVAPTTPASWVKVTSGVVQFHVENGELLWLTQGGDLWSSPIWAAVVAPTTQSSWVHITGSVAQFWMENGELLWLTRTGNVWSAPIWAAVVAPTTPASWVQIGQSAVNASDGSIWFLGTATVDKAGDHAIYRLDRNGQMTQVCVTPAAIGSQWLAMGGPSSPWGLPTGDAYQFEEGQIQHFQHTAVYWSANFGLHSTDGDFELNAAQQALFSKSYLAARDNFLTRFLFQGMSADWVDESTSQVHFGDQTIQMGYALQTYAQEAAVLKHAGLDSGPSERVIADLLQGFDQLTGSAVTVLYGSSPGGFFLRDDIGVDGAKHGDHGIPSRLTVSSSDFSASNPANHTAGDPPNHTQDAMSLDQVLTMLTGWWAVTQYSTSSANIAHAQAQTEQLMSFLQGCGYNVQTPDGSKPSADRNADCRPAAGYISHMADLITGGKHNYLLDPKNTIEIRISKNDILGVLTGGTSAVIEYAAKQWAGVNLGVSGSIPVFVPVSIVYAASETALMTVGTLTFPITINAYLPNWIKNASFTYPTTEKTKWQLWPGGPWTEGFKTVAATETIGDLLSNLNISLGSSYSKQLVFLCMAFDNINPVVSVGMLRPAALSNNNPWASLLSSAVSGVPVDPTTSAQALSAWREVTNGKGLPSDNGPGSWVTANRWINATNINRTNGSKDYNGLDFLSLEGLLRVTHVL